MIRTSADHSLGDVQFLDFSIRIGTLLLIFWYNLSVCDRDVDLRVLRERVELLQEEVEDVQPRALSEKGEWKYRTQ